MKAQLFFAWFDFWVGLFWDKKKSTLYILALPMIGVRIRIIPKGYKIINLSPWMPSPSFAFYTKSGTFIGVASTWIDAFEQLVKYTLKNQI